MANSASKTILTALLLSVLSLFGAEAQYREDILGEGYQCMTITQPSDYDGEVVCSIVRKKSEKPGRAVVYVHGYNDYFFQRALGDSIAAHGYNFYAVDLRKYGRSLLPHQDPFFCKKMDEYFADIDTTIAIARAEGNGQIILMGHSTGCLSLSLYLNENPTKANALVLNSPFFDWYMGRTMENILIPCVSVVGAVFKRIKVQGASDSISCYAQSLQKKHRGEWEYDTAWKKDGGHPKRSGWVRAVNRGHKKVQKGMNIQCPVLVMSSDRSTEETPEWNDLFLQRDIVLDVDEIHTFGAKLGADVTHATIQGGIHDLILSPRPARDEAYKTIFHWLETIGRQNR